MAPLDSAAAAFRLLTTGPGALSLDGREVGGGLPPRAIPLSQVPRLLACSSVETRDRAWSILVARARTGAPAWMVGAVGVALPGLRVYAGRLVLGSSCDPADLEAEVLAGFIKALRQVELSQRAILQRMLWTAYREGVRFRHAEAAAAQRQQPWPATASEPPRPWGHPDLVLADAVAADVISAVDAELIGATRLDSVPLQVAAASAGISYPCARQRRQRAEKRVLSAIRAGKIRSRVSH
jgi:hypothetical protein